MKKDYIKEYSRELMFKNYAENTINCYSGIVLKFLSNYKISPEKINESQIKDYILKYDNSYTKAQLISAISLFYKMVIHQPNKFKYIEYPRKEQKLPQVLSVNEMQNLFDAISNKKHLAILSLLYSCGLRVSEVINLKIEDIQSRRGQIFIEQSKGFKDRYAPLPTEIIKILSSYYKEYSPKIYFFNGQFDEQYSESSIRQFLNKYAKIAGIKKHIHPHQIRHTYAVHQLERGIDLRYIQAVLGHKSSKQTERYTHVSNLNISKIQSPINGIRLSI